MPQQFRRRSQGITPIEPLPAVFPTIQGAEIAAAVAGERNLGEFYDCIRVSPERVLFGMLDLAGRREDNGAILSAAQQTFRESGAELFSKFDINESEAMTELSLRLNRKLLELSEPEVHSCAAFIACYHEKFGTLCYTNSGHTPALLRDRKGIIEMTSTGLPLGLFSHATCDAPTVGMEANAAFLVVSRGVVECGSESHDPSGEFGLDRVKHALERDSRAHAQGLCTSILDAAGKFASGMSYCDDLTALALIRMP